MEDEDASRAYLLQVWAEAMTIYRSGKYSMKFSKSIQRQLVEVQKDFMPEDTEAGQIQGFLEHYTGSMVCSKQLFKEALGHTYDEPKRWQLHNINEIMNTVVTGWKSFSNPRMFAGYGRQKGWERDVSGNELPGNEDGFVAGFVAGDFPVWIRKKPVNKAFSNIYLYFRQRKQRDFSRKFTK